MRDFEKKAHQTLKNVRKHKDKIGFLGIYLSE